MTIQAKDIGFILDAAPGFADGAATAAGTGDATLKAGAIIDYLTLNHPLSGKVVVPWTATLADTKTLSLKIKIQHGDDSALGDVADYTFGGAEVDLGVVGTGDTGGTTEVGVATMDIDLSGVKRYFRVAVTPDLSATGTDTAKFAACIVLGGNDKSPS